MSYFSQESTKNFKIGCFIFCWWIHYLLSGFLQIAECISLHVVCFHFPSSSPLPLFMRTHPSSLVNWDGSFSPQYVTVTGHVLDHINVFEALDKEKTSMIIQNLVYAIYGIDWVKQRTYILLGPPTATNMTPIVRTNLTHAPLEFSINFMASNFDIYTCITREIFTSRKFI